MANLMPLVHQARRTIRNRQDGNPFTTDEIDPGADQNLPAWTGAAHSPGFRREGAPPIVAHPQNAILRALLGSRRQGWAPLPTHLALPSCRPGAFYLALLKGVSFLS